MYENDEFEHQNTQDFEWNNEAFYYKIKNIEMDSLEIEMKNKIDEYDENYNSLGKASIPFKTLVEGNGDNHDIILMNEEGKE